MIWDQSLDGAHDIPILGRVRRISTKDLQNNVVSDWYVSSMMPFPVNDISRMSSPAQQLDLYVVTFITLDIPTHVDSGLLLHYDTVFTHRLRLVYYYNFLMTSAVLFPMCSLYMSSLAQQLLVFSRTRHVMCYAPVQTWIHLRVAYTWYSIYVQSRLLLHFCVLYNPYDESCRLWLHIHLRLHLKHQL